MPLDFSDLEVFYEELALTLDAVDAAKRELFLCKLCLMMARDAGDLSKVQAMIRSAQRHLGEG